MRRSVEVSLHNIFRNGVKWYPMVLESIGGYLETFWKLRGCDDSFCRIIILLLGSFWLDGCKILQSNVLYEGGQRNDWSNDRSHIYRQKLWSHTQEIFLE
jgi:hypothetical protein